TGVGRGENRAVEAAQQAIASPLLDNLSIRGAKGVLINISGGNDLTLGEFTTVSELIHEAAGDESEIIIGSVTEPAMQGEIRVTVIATGFDHDMGVPLQLPVVGRSGGSPISALSPRGGARPSGTVQTATPTPPAPVVPAAGRHPQGMSASELTDMEIPTFIRRQMD
ncbi:MAG: cell division protein FtsZ, partial [Gemmatimonadaceae bacterium]|nr:cell division protein FtsZ [Gemmatimonadaceae bacterium]